MIEVAIRKVYPFTYLKSLATTSLTAYTYGTWLYALSIQESRTRNVIPSSLYSNLLQLTLAPGANSNPHSPTLADRNYGGTGEGLESYPIIRCGSSNAGTKLYQDRYYILKKKLLSGDTGVRASERTRTGARHKADLGIHNA
jgi:hypothetical protein